MLTIVQIERITEIINSIKRVYLSNPKVIEQVTLLFENVAVNATAQSTNRLFVTYLLTVKRKIKPLCKF